MTVEPLLLKLNNISIECSEVLLPVFDEGKFINAFGGIFVEINTIHKFASHYRSDDYNSFLVKNTVLNGVNMACDIFERIKRFLDGKERSISIELFEIFKKSVNLLVETLTRIDITQYKYAETIEKIKRIEVLEVLGIRKNDFQFNSRYEGQLTLEEKENNKKLLLSYVKNDIENFLKFFYNFSYEKFGQGAVPDVYRNHMEWQDIRAYERVMAMGGDSFRIENSIKPIGNDRV